MPAGGRRGRHPRKVQRAASRYTMKSTGDSESPCGVPTIVLNGADSASSNLMVRFVSDSRSRMIRTLSVLRNECKTLKSFSRRIVSNASDRSIPSISITYLYRWHLATSHRCPHINLLDLDIGFRSVSLGLRTPCTCPI